MSYDNNKIIHITGTKGKGSTAAFTESLLRVAHSCNTGMFTSPHLCTPRERIRLNGLPVSESEFASSYWSVYNALSSASSRPSRLPGLPPHPTYFRYLTLLSLYIFHHHPFPPSPLPLHVILEVGMGGLHDATNVYPLSHASCITQLDLDHTRVLGDTIEEIAREKGGIIKRGCKTWAADAEEGTKEVLRE
ncbi:hypothetical protein TrRE_jg12509, partial [Triparma retinervis]